MTTLPVRPHVAKPFQALSRHRDSPHDLGCADKSSSALHKAACLSLVMHAGCTVADAQGYGGRSQPIMSVKLSVANRDPSLHASVAAAGETNMNLASCVQPRRHYSNRGERQLKSSTASPSITHISSLNTYCILPTLPIILPLPSVSEVQSSRLAPLRFPPLCRPC